MRTSLSSIALAAALAAGSAQAADLPSRKEPPPVAPPPPVLTWNGFYVGLNLGGGWQDRSSSNVWNNALLWANPALFPGGAFPVWGWGGNNGGGGSGGVVGGGQIGYNFQFSPWLVIGAETDFQGTSIGGGGGGNWWGGGVDLARINWFGTVRGRLGVTFPGWSSVLLYGTGGFAYGEVQRNFWWNQNSAVQTGWTAGGGAEWMFMPNWSAKVEYLYTDISGANQNLWWNPGFGLNNVNNHTRFHTVRAGVNWHFNLFGGGSTAPVLARY
ncbi:outer membrane protein [Methylocystis sp. S23]|jgi:outer membrane immunogenic protein